MNGRYRRAQLAKGWVAVIATTAICAAPFVASRADAAEAEDAASPVASATQKTPIVISETFSGSVTRVVDDHTLIIHRADRDFDETVCLFGVKPVPFAAPDGQSARAYLNDHFKDAKVRVESRSRDRAGNLSALVSLVPPTVAPFQQPPDVSGIGSGLPYRATNNPVASPQPQKTINEKILSLGLARYDYRQAPDEKALADAEMDAQKGNKGFWSADSGVGSGMVSSAEKAGK